MIYPEAHVWPYATKIRPFSKASFHFPVENNLDSFCVTTTYQKSKLFKKPKVVIYVDSPFVVDNELSRKEKSKALAEAVSNKMIERSKISNVEFVTYKKKDN